MAPDFGDRVIQNMFRLEGLMVTEPERLRNAEPGSVEFLDISMIGRKLEELFMGYATRIAEIGERERPGGLGVEVCARRIMRAGYRPEITMKFLKNAKGFLEGKRNGGSFDSFYGALRDLSVDMTAIEDELGGRTDIEESVEELRLVGVRTELLERYMRT